MRFYKLIMDPDYDQLEIRLPEKFVRLYGSTLPKRVKLSVPDGRTSWKVKLTRRKHGQMWLSKGWSDFAEFLRLQFGDLLMFVYKEGEFDVFVMDKTSCEIEYPVENDGSVDQCADDSALRRAGREQILRDACGDGMVYDNDVSPRRAVTINREGLENINRKYKHGKRAETESKQLEGSDNETSDGTCKTENDGRVQYFSKFTAHQTEEPFLIAKNFEFKEPVQIITMLMSYIPDKYMLCIPGAFIMRYFDLKIRYGSLWFHDQQPWSLLYGLNGHQVYSCGDWKNFVVENNLNVGDVCAFELVKEIVNTLKVRIFRAILSETENNDVDRSADKPDMSASKRSAKKGIIKDESDDDIVVVHDDNEYDVFPRRARMGSRKRVRRVTIATRNTNKMSDQTAIRNVADTETEINLMEGYNKVTSDKNFEPENDGITQYVVAGTAFRTQENFLRAKRFRYKEPVLIVVMRKTYVRNHCILRIPIAFIVRYFNLKITNVSLWIHSQKPCSVLYNISGREGYFCGGWRKFAIENKLIVGDVCAFELVKNVSNTLQVRIFRTTSSESDGINVDRYADELDESTLNRTGTKRTTELECDDNIVVASDHVEDDVYTWRMRLDSRKRVRRESPDKMFSHTARGIVAETVSEHMELLNDETSDTTLVLENDGRVQYIVGSTAHQGNEAFLRAKSFKFDEPVLILNMKSSYIYQPFIPSNFIMRYFNLKIKHVSLWIHRQEPCSVVYSLSGCHAYFGDGWKKFAADNNLTAGDVCTFELLKEVENTLLVRIFRAMAVKGENRDNEIQN